MDVGRAGTAGRVTMDDLSLNKVLTEGWEAFKKYMGLAIGGYVVYAIITGVGSNIPVLNIAYVIVAMFPLMGGLYLLMLNIVKDQNPEFGDIFKGFNDMVRWMGVGWLLALYSLIPAIICAIPMALGGWLLNRGGVLAVIGGLLYAVAVVAIIAAAIMFYMRWVFVYFVAADEGLTASAAIQRSTELTDGIRVKLFGYVIVLGLIAAAGAIVVGIGALFTAPLAMCALTALYLDVKNARGPQAAAEAQAQVELQAQVEPQMPAEPQAPAEPETPAEPEPPSEPAA